MMKMNIKYSLLVALTALMSLVGCQNEVVPQFAIDSNDITVEPAGAEMTLKVSSPGKWIASANVPWITVTPTNGIGSCVCKVLVDSSVVFSSDKAVREGVVRIQNEDWENREVKITQKNFPYQIALSKKEQSIPNYKSKSERKFEVVVKTNVDFKVEMEYTEDIEAGVKAGWLKAKDHELVLDRGARPRNVTLTLDWDINSVPSERLAKVKFVPVNERGEEIGTEGFSVCDILNVVQSSAEKIQENTRQGDSTALLGIARTLGVEEVWDSADRLDNWDGVELWDTSDERDGRVKSAQFVMFETEDGIPFEVQYLTAAEKLVFFSNVNSFLRKGMDIGPYILKLEQLKELSISAYGLDELTSDFARLKNLERLNLSGNNFKDIPAVLTKENFPKLKSLTLNGNQRGLIYDLSNLTVEESNFAGKYGGLYDENLKAENHIEGSDKRGFPVRFLTWDTLEELVLSVNYLQGELPSDDYVASLGLQTYTEEEISATDTLSRKLIGMPKVMPNMEFLTLNLNRFRGKLPDWILYHPKLDLWQPLQLVFVQEGKDIKGNLSVFDNAPSSLEYYYKLDGYKNKKYSPYNTDKK